MVLSTFKGKLKMA